MMNSKNKAFLESLIPGAQAAHKEHDVPASVTLAQAILESAWGQSKLTLEGCNLFGIKADKSWHGESIMKPTTEYIKGKRITVQAPFRKYKSLADSIADHALFLRNNKRYSKAFECGNGCEFAEAIAKAGYATDPAYSALLIAIIKQHKLDQYDA